ARAGCGGGAAEGEQRDPQRLGGAGGQASGAQGAEVSAQPLACGGAGTALTGPPHVVDQAQRADPCEDGGVRGPPGAGGEHGDTADDEGALEQAHPAAGEVGAAQLGAQRGAHPSPPSSEGVTEPSPASCPAGCPWASPWPVSWLSPSAASCASPCASSWGWSCAAACSSTPCVSGRDGRRSSASAVVP